MSERTASTPRSAATRASAASLRPVTATRAPSALKACAAARPIPVVPPSTTTLFSANRMSEHAVGVGGLLWDWLNNVPVLHDLTTLHAQYVNHGNAPVIGRKCAMGMDGDQISVRNHTQNRVVDCRMLGKKRLEKPDGRFTAGLRHGVVLDITWINPGFKRLADLLVHIKLSHEAGDHLLRGEMTTR